MIRIIFLLLSFALMRASRLFTNMNVSMVNGTIGFSIFGANASAVLGASVSKAGDVNGDGIDDIIVGAPYSHPYGRNSAGVVYVIYGRKNWVSSVDVSKDLINNTLGFRISGANTSDRCGTSVNHAGDINGDGIDDIIIGASYSAQFEKAQVGAAYVIYGKKNGHVDIDLKFDLSNNTLGFKMFGVSANGRLGESISRAGDINNDGINDIILAAPFDSTFSFNGGIAYVIYGKRALFSDFNVSTYVNNTTGFKIFSVRSEDWLGFSVSFARDVNGDGIDDILIGARLGDSLGRIDSGTAYVIFGRKDGLPNIYLNRDLTNNTLGFKILAGLKADYLGDSVSSAGDINGDGIYDIIVGAINANSTYGVSYVIFGRNGNFTDIDLNNTDLSGKSIGFKITGEHAGSLLGDSVCSIGDINADDVDDILIGSTNLNAPGISLAGGAYVIYGNKTQMLDIDLQTDLINNTLGFRISGNNIGDKVGSSVGSGDFNGDGTKDIIFSAARTDALGKFDSGAAHVMFGIPKPPKKDMTTIAGLTDALDSASQVSNVGTSLFNLVNSGNPGAICLNSLLAGLIYIKYLNISFPPELQYLLNESDNNPVDSVSPFLSVPEALKQKMSNYTLPEVFELRGFGSSFLVNFWSSFLNLAIIVVITFLICSLECCTRRVECIHRIFLNLKQILKWNFILITFTGYYGDISLYTSLEMRTLHFDNVFDDLSFCICLLMNIITFTLFIRMIMIVRKLNSKSTTRLNLGRYRMVHKEYGDYEVVFKSFKNDSLIQQYFFIFFCLRQYIFYTVVSYLFEYPLTQMILINFMGFGMLLYLLWKRPPKDKIDLIQSIIQEIMFQVVHICTLILAILDTLNSENLGTRETIGRIIIGCFTAFQTFSIVYLGLQLLKSLKEVFRYLRRKISRGKPLRFSINIRKSKLNDQNLVLTNNSQKELSKNTESKLTDFNLTAINDTQVKEQNQNHSLTVNTENLSKQSKRGSYYKAAPLNRLFEYDAYSSRSNTFKRNYINAEVNERFAVENLNQSEVVEMGKTNSMIITTRTSKNESIKQLK